MVIDKLENLEKYVSLNPLFAEAVAFLKATDLQAHEVGKVVLKEGELGEFCRCTSEDKGRSASGNTQ